MNNNIKIIELNSKRTFDLSDFLTIGSDKACSHTFNALEPRHFRLEKKENNKILIKDLRTQSGTRLNDVAILEAEIFENDIIDAGPLSFQILKSNISEQLSIKSLNQPWQKQLELIPQMAKTDFTVLILGPSGTGKDIIAQNIHQISDRTGPYVGVNCCALSETLIESELFGHVKGSFTGAINDRKGAFETARGGTLFLDEIGDLPISLQAKLLRALENNEITPVGSDKPIQTDVRVVAATHQNLYEMALKGKFRTDLYYRLNVLKINTPALIDRMEDFEPLLFQFSKKHKVRFSFDAIQELKKHTWPGNIRELRNTVCRASAIIKNESVKPEHIPHLVEKIKLIATSENLVTIEELKSEDMRLPFMKELEKQLILKRLAANHGNQKRTAKELGIPKSTLHDRVKSYGIDPKQFSAPNESLNYPSA
jgi:transcriptional regulator with PAS, ATPase and Fis domain